MPHALVQSAFLSASLTIVPVEDENSLMSWAVTFKKNGRVQCRVTHMDVRMD